MAKTGERSLLIGILMLCGVVGIALLAYVKFAPADVVPNQVEIKKEDKGGGGVRLLTPYYKDNELVFRSEEVKVPPGEDKYVFAVNRYLRSVEAVPIDAVLVKCTVKDGLATMDFNAAFRTSYGTDDESTLLNGLMTVMGQFQDVSFIKITVEGKDIESIGNMDLIDPLQVTRMNFPVSKPEPAKPATK